MKKIIFILILFFSISVSECKAGLLDSLIGLIASIVSGEYQVSDPGINQMVNPGMPQSYIRLELSTKKDVTENQEKIKDWTRIIDQRIDSLTRLEKKTIDYLSDTQEEAIDSEDLDDILIIANDIITNNSKCAEIVARCPELSKTALKLQVHCAARGNTIISKIKQFAQVDGKGNMLDNKQRDDIILMVIDDLKDMRSMSNYVLATLRAAEKKQYLQNNL